VLVIITKIIRGQDALSRSKIVNAVETLDWRAEIMAYLRGHYEPQDELE
jgi:hypothetical protein